MGGMSPWKVWVIVGVIVFIVSLLSSRFIFKKEWKVALGISAVMVLGVVFLYVISSGVVV